MKVTIVDGSSFIHRAYHAAPALTSPQGVPTGALTFFGNMLKGIMLNSSEHLIMVFDTRSSKDSRLAKYPEYKANRSPMPDELRTQVALIEESVRLFGVPCVKAEGVEADDVIACLTKAALDAGASVEICTGDKDLMQLVGSGVTWRNTQTNTVLDANGVFDKFGCWPDQITDYLALIGDAVDNVPGVNGIGHKTAAHLLRRFGTLEGIYDCLSDVAIDRTLRGAASIAKKLESQHDMALLSLDLVTLDDDAYPAPNVLELRRRDPLEHGLASFIEEYGLNSWKNFATDIKEFYNDLN